MSTIKKSFVLNNGLANVTKSHITQLFKPTYNPKMDDADYVASMPVPGTATNHFALQYFDWTGTGTITNPIVGPYCSNPGTKDAKNVVTNLFLVSENFLSFITKINNFWYKDDASTPRVITPVTYAPDANGKLIATANTTYTQRQFVIDTFSGSSGNNASAGLLAYENMASYGVEGSTANDGTLSCSIHELFLRHLYSVDSRKRNIAFGFAQSFYGISLTEINLARLEMIPAVDFDSDKFEISMTDDIVKFEYNSPIKLQQKYDETIHNTGNKNIYLYFPFITSNALRANNDTNKDYHNFISVYNGLSSPTASIPTAFTAITFVKPILTRAKATTGVGTLAKNGVESAPTLTNSIWSVSKEKSVNQAGYTALRISEVGGGGDLQFDHTDKIDYIDSLTIEIKVPTVFS